MLGPVYTTSVSSVFIGRTEELGALTDALARAAHGQPQALLMGGEAGVGKTRLVEEFATVARAAGAVTALGGCVEIGVDGLPFAPVSTVLRALRRQLGDELDQAAAGQEGELARLLPELGETAPEARDEDGRARLFELTARLLERLATDRTLVIVIEDLHWADRSTRELLGYLFRSVQRAQLVIVATYRSDDIHRRHPLRPFVAEVDRMRTVRRIELGRFSRAEVRAQIAGIYGAEPDRLLVDRVFERTDGNAFFVEEIARSIHDGCQSGLSETLRDLLLVRVEALPDTTQRVVRTVAEGGSQVEHGLLAAVARLGEDELIEALRTAVGANILLPTGDDSGYRFRHALVREAVADDLLPGERTRLNQQYATALEADPTLVRSDEYGARLASYWYHAHEPAKALPAVLAASVAARRRHAYAEQLRLLERAMELWEDTPAEVRAAQWPLAESCAYPVCSPCEDDQLRHLDLLAEVVTAAYLSGQRERALALAKRALRTIDEARDPLRAAWFWTQASKSIEGLTRGNGWAELSRAQELVRGLPPSVVHAEVLAAAAGWLAVHEPGPDNYATAERAVELARLVDAADLELHARVTLGGLMINSGDVEGGLTEMADAAARAVDGGHISVISRCYINLASALESIGRSAEAVDAARTGVRAAETFGLVDTKAWTYGNMAESLISLGRWDEALEAAQEAERYAQGAKPRGAAANRRAQLALDRGDWATAHVQHAAARAYYGSHDPQPQYTITIARHALTLAAHDGDIARARAILVETLDAGIPIGTQRYAWPLLLAAATVEADARGLPLAEPGREEVLHCIYLAAKRLAQPVPVWQAFALMVAAELLRAQGRDTPAHWSEVAAAFAPLDRPYQLAQARYRWAEARLTAGDPPVAGRPAGDRSADARVGAATGPAAAGEGPDAGAWPSGVRGARPSGPDAAGDEVPVGCALSAHAGDVPDGDEHRAAATALPSGPHPSGPHWPGTYHGGHGARPDAAAYAAPVEPAEVGTAREHAASLLARAYATAERLAAHPLCEAITLLAARARLTLPVRGAGRPGPGVASAPALREIGAGHTPAGRGDQAPAPAESATRDLLPAPGPAAHRPGAGDGRAQDAGAGRPPTTGAADLAGTAPPVQDPADAFRLTPRERDVLRLVAVGRSNRQIAEELFISPKTASVHVSNILAKLEVSGRGEAAAMAHRLRLITPA
ncbi:AAA family ATPase [Streptomyces sp. 796.1]|uniref:helix-turn-helix transcriptional regulator n=1 Tax=Streptomyces sp. 796.1 TaxID=3163029 RepID=UPI0039C92C3E